MDIRVLGPLEVERGGKLLSLGGTKQRSVLAVLLLNAREVVGAERLADAIWDGEPPPSGDSTLRAYVSNLRKVLEPDRGPNDPPSVLRTTPTGYVLDVDDDQIDARRFEKTIRAGRERRASGDVTGAAEAWSQALTTWRGDAFQDFAYSGFVQTEAGRLTELRLSCTEDLFEARLELGQHDAVVGDLEAFCDSNPSRERALRLRMLALYRCGRQSEALGAYEEGRRRLGDELGIDPSLELRTLHEQMVRQDPELEAPKVQEAPRKQTLTFLLGDVERSTDIARSLGDDYAGVLEAHRRLLEETLSTHGSHEVRAWGDELLAVFGSASDAVDGAVTAQLALSRAATETGHALAVRMGLHTGEATFTSGDYVGLCVHQTARIMDAAHGGQVLVSHATKELCQAEGRSDADLADLGVHRLKDIPGTVRLFQVLHPELRRDFPPLRTRSARTDNLPQRPTSFVGREADVVQVAAALAEARVVTLTGVGGVGKTRLALEAGERLIPRYADGVWLCELAAIGDAGALVPALASVLNLQQQAGQSMRQTLLSALRQRHTLLVLDNCEHLLEPVAELIEEIVHDTTTVDILATSREAIGADGERTLPVRSLTMDDNDGAVRLFADRAGAVRPDFVIGDSNASDVAGICRRLDGIPLAIELAAARVISMSPAQIAARLEEGFRFLRSGRRAAVDRHRTLHGAIDWSYALLSEPERKLFDRLSVFVGGFTLEAAEDVCGHNLSFDIADGLASLVAKSMVSADATGAEVRYALLETLRQYGQARLEENDEAATTVAAHARHFVRMFERAWGPSDLLVGPLGALDADSLRPLVTEFDNLRAAHAWTIATQETDLALRLVAAAYYLFATHQSPEAHAWATAALSLPGADDHPSRPEVLTVLADSKWRRGDLEGADELAARVLSSLDDPDDPRRIWLIATRAAVKLFQADFEEARLLSDEHFRLTAKVGGAGWQVFGRCSRALVESYDGQTDEALKWAEDAYALAVSTDSGWKGWALYILGEVVGDSDPERALDCLDRSIELTEPRGMRFQMGVALVSAASLRARHGEPIDALRRFHQAVDHWRLAGNWTQQWTTLRNLAELFARVGADVPAATLLAAAGTAASAPRVFGPHGERLTRLEKELGERLGPGFAAAAGVGRNLADEEVVRYALGEIDRALELVPTNG